jgi:hypothetical protein
VTWTFITSNASSSSRGFDAFHPSHISKRVVGPGQWAGSAAGCRRSGRVSSRRSWWILGLPSGTVEKKDHGAGGCQMHFSRPGPAWVLPLPQYLPARLTGRPVCARQARQDDAYRSTFAKPNGAQRELFLKIRTYFFEDSRGDSIGGRCGSWPHSKGGRPALRGPFPIEGSPGPLGVVQWGQEREWEGIRRMITS